MRPYSKEDEQKREERGKSPKGNSMAQVQIVETQSRHDQKWRDWGGMRVCEKGEVYDMTRGTQMQLVEAWVSLQCPAPIFTTYQFSNFKISMLLILDLSRHSPLLLSLAWHGLALVFLSHVLTTQPGLCLEDLWLIGTLASHDLNPILVSSTSPPQDQASSLFLQTCLTLDHYNSTFHSCTSDFRFPIFAHLNLITPFLIQSWSSLNIFKVVLFRYPCTPFLLSGLFHMCLCPFPRNSPFISTRQLLLFLIVPLSPLSCSLHCLCLSLLLRVE